VKETLDGTDQVALRANLTNLNVFLLLMAHYKHHAVLDLGLHFLLEARAKLSFFRYFF